MSTARSIAPIVLVLVGIVVLVALVVRRMSGVGEDIRAATGGTP